MTEARTHLGVDARWVGEVLALDEGSARVGLQTTAEMAVDEYGLLHGGFVFGLADYAAMLAVNDPHVVLGAAETRFLQPVSLGDSLVAEASLEAEEGPKRLVLVQVRRGSTMVFSGEFTCFVLEHHVLEQ